MLAVLIIAAAASYTFAYSCTRLFVELFRRRLTNAFVQKAVALRSPELTRPRGVFLYDVILVAFALLPAALLTVDPSRSGIAPAVAILAVVSMLAFFVAWLLLLVRVTEPIGT
jgi:hypothetical protein